MFLEVTGRRIHLKLKTRKHKLLLPRKHCGPKKLEPASLASENFESSSFEYAFGRKVSEANLLIF